MSCEHERRPAEILAEHVRECTPAQSVVVIDGSGDETIAKMIAAGWTLDERTDYVLGKRIRFLIPPEES